MYDVHTRRLKFRKITVHSIIGFFLLISHLRDVLDSLATIVKTILKYLFTDYCYFYLII